MCSTVPKVMGVLRSARSVRVDVVDLVRSDVRVRQRFANGADDGASVGSGAGAVVVVRLLAAPADNTQDPRSPGSCGCVRLKDEGPRALAQDEAIAPFGEGA